MTQHLRTPFPRLTLLAAGLTGFFAARAAPAAASPTLQDLLSSAERQNLDQRLSLVQRERASAELVQAWSALLPSVTATGSWTHNQYETAISFPGAPEPITIVPLDQLDAVIRIELPLVDVGRWARTAAAVVAEDAAESRSLLALDVMRRQVVASYYGYAAALAVRSSAQKANAVADSQLTVTTVRAEAGAVTELDRLRAAAEVHRTRQLIADTEALVAIARRTLRTLTGVELGDEVTLPEDDLHPEGTLAELEPGIDKLPAVQLADKELQAAERLSWAARFAVVPSVSAQFTERITNATGFAGEEAVYNAGLNLVWRLDAPTFATMNVQSIAVDGAVISTERARQQAKDLLHSDWQRLNAALAKVEAAQAQAEAARLAAQVARDRYSAGAATQVDVIQAERDLFGAEVGQIQARTELATARLVLRLSAGRPLGLDG